MSGMTLKPEEQLEEVDLAQVNLDPTWSRLLPAGEARRQRALALCRVHDEVIVATSNPCPDAVRRFVAEHVDGPFRLVRAEETSLRSLLGRVYSRRPPPTTSGPLQEDSEFVEAGNDLMSAACLRGASDIHIVPGESTSEIRFRVDGVLEPYRSIPIELHTGLVSRIKVLAGLNIAEKREPQDGRFSWQSTMGHKTDVRVATIPTRHGERVTLRLLMAHSHPTLEELGMGEQDLELFNSALQCPSGLVLLTGPTGCGKSTTLVAALKQLQQSRGGNIITIEDPVEYEISGVTQVEVDAAAKVSFPRALRSILRHDPDVIMLGEIRDAETAELAIKAALTGHLVLSTLHTNTAAGVVTRLTDMGIEPFLLAATLRLAVAQRLVRQLCSHCRLPAAVSESDALALEQPTLAGQQAFEASRCLYCAGKGYTGRTALFEMLPGNPQLAEQISARASEAELVSYMRRTDCTLLRDDGIRKVLSGTTTAQQVLSSVAMW